MKNLAPLIAPEKRTNPNLNPNVKAGGSDAINLSHSLFFVNTLNNIDNLPFFDIIIRQK
jgi:hypothetical protein